MKKVLSIALVLSTLMFFGSCSQTLNPGFNPDDYEPIVSPESVHTLKSLASGEFIILSESTFEDLVFEWDATPAAGNTVFRYEVLFDTEDGDFSKPIATYKSDNFALDTKLTLSHVEVNILGVMAGYKANSKGLIRWKVRTYCGLDEALSSLEGRFLVMMMDGIDDIPNPSDAVYITGEATEDGGDFSFAQKMQMLSEGKYEAYLKLRQNKTYTFSAEIDGEIHTYYYSDKLRQRLASEDYETLHEQTDGIYRVTVDFQSREVKVAEVTRLFLFCIAGSYEEDFHYAGQGTWELKNYTAHKRKESWAGGGETRYHLRMDLKDATTTSWRENWGHSGRDVSEPQMNDEGEFADYSYFNMYSMSGSWDYSFRYSSDLLKWGTENNGKWLATIKADVTIYLNAEFAQYTHRWQASENQ